MRHVARQGTLPMSYAQQRLWFVGQMDRTSATYNLATAMRVTGRLDESWLEQAFSEVVRRHEVLRTTFRTVDGEPVQVIAATAAQPLELRDLSQLEEGEREEEVERLASAEAERPFDLSSGPLLRVSLLRCGDAEHVLLLTMHHIISDGWSMSVLVREVAALYEAYAQGAESPLAELEFQYADYAVWQREYLEGAVLEQQLAYWKQQLAGAPPVLELPADYPRPKVKGFTGATLPVQLRRSLSGKLKALSQGQDVTLFMTLLAGFQVVLWRYTRQEDGVVGTPLADRARRSRSR